MNEINPNNIIGTWKISENILTLYTVPLGINYQERIQIQEQLLAEIIITIINRDNIVFEFPDGNKEVLIRNNN